MPTDRRPPALPLLACLSIGACGQDARGPGPEAPNILLVTLDTTRRDHLGCYGYDRPTSPHIDRLARDSLVFTSAYAVSSWTMPTHASLFTGKFPSAHGANYDPEGPLKLSEGIQGNFGHYRARPIAEQETTLAQILSERGWATGGIVGGPWMKAIFRLGRGFQHYDDANISELNGRSAGDITRAAIEFVDQHRGRPFFLFLNYYDPHSPWGDEQKKQPYHDLRPVMPPGLDPSKLDAPGQAALLYDSEIRYMDQEFGRLLEHLRASGLYERTWIIVTSDHGEMLGDPMLGEAGVLWGHGDSLSQAEIHIPLLMKEPGPAGRRGLEATPIQQVDIVPTILARLGLPLPPDIQGTPDGARHPVVCELYKLPMMNRSSGPRPKDWRHMGDWRVLVEGRHKFGWSSNGTHFLVDLEQDPLERTNLAASSPALVSELEQRLSRYIESLPEPSATGAVPELDESTMQALEGLGYTGEDEHPPLLEAPQAGAPSPSAPADHRDG
jgi:arylsulfatase